MNVSGSHRFAAPRASVFAAICDPATLMAVIPGCEAVQQTGPAAYEGRIALRLPGAVGSYRTSVRLVDVAAPHRAGMEGDVVGAMGSIRGRADFVLRDAGDATELTWRGDAVIQGPLARLDSRFAERLAESLIDQGLRALAARLELATAPLATAPLATGRATQAITEGPE